MSNAKNKRECFQGAVGRLYVTNMATLRDPCRTVKNCLSDIDKFTVYIIEKISLMSSIVINVPTRASLAVATKDLFVPVVGTFKYQKQCL